MQNLCDAHRASACKLCRGHGGAATTTLGAGAYRARRRAGAHRALGEPAPRPWEGRRGKHLTPGPLSFRRAAALVVGGGGGARSPPVTHNPLA